MRIFDFDPKQYREQYAEQGWIHVPEGVGAEFLRTLTAFVQDHFAEHEVEGRGVHGTKTQAVYVVMFQGSSTWHKRRNAAGATNLYLKFNDFGSDPLGEDPATPARWEATKAALAGGDIGALVPVPARRLDTIARAQTREPGREIVIADVWGEGKVPLSTAEAELLASLNGATVAELGAEDAIRRLARRGVIDLV